MLWGDISLEKDENGEYLTFKERSTKTRTGAGTDTRWFQPKAYENKRDPRKCPVRLYKLFRDRRPLTMLQPDSPFFLAINHGNKSLTIDSQEALRKWYKQSPLGPNQLGSMMKFMAKEAGFVGKYTNHSLRKTMCNTLLQAGVPPTLIQQMSGHKNVASISNYATASKKQQREMADIVANPGLVVAQASNAQFPQVPTRSFNGNTECNTTHGTTANVMSSVQAGQFSGANITGCTFNVITVHKE